MSEQNTERHLRSVPTGAAVQPSASAPARPPSDLTPAVEGRKKAAAELKARRRN